MRTLDVDDLHRSQALVSQFAPIARRVLWLAKMGVGKEVAVPRGDGSERHDLAVIERMTGQHVYVNHPRHGTMAFTRSGGHAVGNRLVLLQDPRTVETVEAVDE